MSENNIIEAFDLTKVYKLKSGEKLTALNNVSFSVKEGEIFGLLGPNGAGKTTLVSILSTLMRPSHGYANVLGYNILKYPNKVKKKIGLMLGDEIVYYRLTGMDNLKFFCRIYNVKDYKTKIKEMTERLGIEHKLNEYVSSMSRGQKLRIALSRVLLIEPEILFLDEPLLGMDPKTTRVIINFLQELNKTILLTSHQMHIIETLCNRIAFLNKGDLIKIDTQENYKKMISGFIRVKFEIFDKNKKQELKNELKGLNYITHINEEKHGFTVSISENKNYPDLLTFLGRYPVSKVNEIEPSLDDVFIELS